MAQVGDVKQATDGPAVAEIDLHCHLLPAWDDGPRDLEESVALAARAYEAGIRTIAVTPHVGRDLGFIAERDTAEIPAATRQLQETLQSRGIDIKLVSGAEVALSSIEIIERVIQEKWMTFGEQGRYVLVESIFGSWPVSVDVLLDRLLENRITPIIAHPERYSNVQNNTRAMEQLVQRGVLLQVTARCLAGGANPREEQCCRHLLEAGMVAIVASDSHHSARGVWPNDIAPALQKLVGSQATHEILIENPRRVLAGLPTRVPTIEVPEKKSRFTLRGLLNPRR